MTNKAEIKKSTPFLFDDLALDDESKAPLKVQLMHEIKNPTHVAMGLIEYLNSNWDKLDEATKKDCIQNINISMQSTKGLLDLLDQVEDLQEIPYNCENMDIVAFTEDIVRHLKNSHIYEEDFVIEMDTAIDECNISLDQFWYRQLIQNLIINAIHYSKKVRITVSIRRAQVQEEEYCLIAICDEGRGIPEEDLTKIFDFFYRGPKSKPSENKAEKKGLGLAICKAIMTAHNGLIKAENQIGDQQGTIMKCFFPVIKK